MKHVALRGTSVRFGKLPALVDVDLDLVAGEAMVLAGPNGAGKTTLIRVLLGLVRPDAGHIEVDGEPRKVDNRLKELIGYLPEAVAFAENLTGKQVLRFFASARGVSKQRVAEVLERVGLTHAAGRAVRGYSRGMRQRLGLAIAILSTPELLILDEPTGGLDQEGLSLLWSVIAEWRKAGRMVLIATHELALIERRVDRMCLLRSGAVRVVDTPRRLREIAALPVRVSFTLGDDGQAGALVERVRAHLGDVEVERRDDMLGVDVSPRELLGVLDLRSEFPDAVRAIRVEEPGLDMVYEHMLQEDS